MDVGTVDPAGRVSRRQAYSPTHLRPHRTAGTRYDAAQMGMLDSEKE
jgi:hypothetical protein